MRHYSRHLLNHNKLFNNKEGVVISEKALKLKSDCLTLRILYLNMVIAIISVKLTILKSTLLLDYTLGEVTSQNLWPRYDRHFVGITWHNVWS